MNTVMVNMGQCLKASESFGSTTWYNVCDKSSQLVPWGGLDWLQFVTGTTIFLAGVSVVAIAAVGVARAMYEDLF